MARVEEVLQDAADGLEDVAGGDAVLVLDVPLPQQPHPLLHVEGLQALHQSGSISLVEDYRDCAPIGWIMMWLTPALLCHKEPTQDTQGGGFHAWKESIVGAL